jgi:hypothetical protein
MTTDYIEELAEAHVDWFLSTIRPLLITHFVHGYKHGRDDKK